MHLLIERLAILLRGKHAQCKRSMRPFRYFRDLPRHFSLEQLHHRSHYPGELLAHLDESSFDQ